MRFNLKGDNYVDVDLKKTGKNTYRVIGEFGNTTSDIIGALVVPLIFLGLFLSIIFAFMRNLVQLHIFPNFGYIGAGLAIITSLIAFFAIKPRSLVNFIGVMLSCITMSVISFYYTTLKTMFGTDEGYIDFNEMNLIHIAIVFPIQLVVTIIATLISAIPGVGIMLFFDSLVKPKNNTYINRVNQIIVLQNKKEYYIFQQFVYQGENYFFVKEVEFINDEKIFKGDFFYLHETIENGEIYTEVFQNIEILTKFEKYLNNDVYKFVNLDEQ